MGTTTLRFAPAVEKSEHLAHLTLLDVCRQVVGSAPNVPHKLLLALMLHTYRDHFYVAGPPVWLQKVMFAALAPIARLKGYRLPLSPATRRRKVRNAQASRFGVGALQQRSN